MKRLIALFCFVLLLIVVGCHTDESDNHVSQEESQKIKDEIDSTGVSIETSSRAQKEENTVRNNVDEDSLGSDDVLDRDDLITSLMSNMSLEEKVAQLFIVDFYGMTGTYHIDEFNQSIDEFLEKYPVGGLIYFAENIRSENQLLEFNSKLQEQSEIDMFIAIDEEGGLVSRLGKADVGVTHLSSARDLSRDNTIDEVYNLAYQLGLDIGKLGFNYDFAPVFDVDTNPNNPVIGNRSFSDEAEVVAEYGISFSKGLNEAGIMSAAKHFPGHGDTSTDSHLGIASLEHDRDRLESIELVPFIKAIEANIPSIMVGHISMPNITGDYTPASLSSYVMTELLRHELGYEGLIISDSFRMKAITDYYGEEELGVLFLEAGGDIILIPESFSATYEGILKAVNDNRLSEERINESVKRILELKLKYGIISE